jgi:S-adenosylmethionine:tRNA ribosyltransferase-isomerase
MGNKLLNNEALHLNEIAVQQWDPYNDAPQHTATEALKALQQYMLQHQMSKLTTRTQIIIAPGYRWKLVEGLVTNFHQPQSTLLLLVAALIGEDWRRVYDYALVNDYRFLSYGDGSLLWGNKQ